MAAPVAESETIVVIGYGNPLRGDDGAGPLAAEAVADLRLPGVRTISAHQLTPELAEPLASARIAVFVDARVETDAEDARCERLEPLEASAALDHTCDPRRLLALSRAVFGRCPDAWLVTIRAVDVSLGEGLSPTAERGLAEALDRIAGLIGQPHATEVGRACRA